MSQIDLSVIESMFAAQLSANESEETIKTLRPKAEEAVKELMRQQNKPKGWTGTIEYHGIKIVVSRPKSCTWEQNNQIQDANLDFYKQQHALYEQLSDDLKELRADMKRTSAKLEKAHPDSESIKYGFRIAFQTA